MISIVSAGEHEIHLLFYSQNIILKMMKLMQPCCQWHSMRVSDTPSINQLEQEIAQVAVIGLRAAFLRNYGLNQRCIYIITTALSSFPFK